MTEVSIKVTLRGVYSWKGDVGTIRDVGNVLYHDFDGWLCGCIPAYTIIT